MSVEANTKLYILKYKREYEYTKKDNIMIVFTANRADYGGALYVNDGTSQGIMQTNRDLHFMKDCWTGVL